MFYVYIEKIGRENVMKDFSKVPLFFSTLERKLGSRPILAAVRRGLAYMIPLLMLGSMALVFLSLPIPAYQELMHNVFGDGWKGLFLFLRDGTFNILSLLMVISVSYAYVIEVSAEKETKVSPISASMVSLSSLVVLIGISKPEFTVQSFGVLGIFLSIVVGILSTMLFIKLSSIEILRLRMYSDGADATLQSIIASTFPASITILIFGMINVILGTFFGITELRIFLSDVFVRLFSMVNSSFLSALLFILCVHVFWFVGIHGSNVLEPVAQMLFASGLYRNQSLLSVGGVPSEIFTKTFFDSFVLMGGCGSALCLVLAMIFFGRQRSQKDLGKIALVPVLFNINELVVFGLPIVLNPIYFIPFLLIPLLLTLTSYGAMRIGLVPFTIHSVEWTTPIFLSGYEATGSIRGSILQLFNLSLGIACYLPFVRLAEAVSSHRVEKSLERLYEVFRHSESHGGVSSLLSRQDEVGNISRIILADLKASLETGDIRLFYQPQVDYHGKVIGIEALLRWKHKKYGYIYPPFVIALAEESGIMSRLGNHILEVACRELKAMEEAGIPRMEISVNVSANQLREKDFAGSLAHYLQKYQLMAGQIVVEITEQVALSNGTHVAEQLKALKKMGVKLAMDDFGMGHSSLMYLKEYEFDVIKLDGSLIREILTNPNCCNIISSILFLGESVGYAVLAEYVETEAQKEVLHALGCDRYQGYLYSKAIPLEETVTFIKESGSGLFFPEEAEVEAADA